MGRPQVFTSETTLYHATEGARVFPVGETDPGGAWSDKPGGDRSETSMPSVMKDLIEANDRADALGERLEAQARDMLETAADATAAKEKVADLEQRAIAAEKAQADAEEAAKGYMVERDTVRAEVDRLTGEAKAANELATEAGAKVDGLVAAVDAANQQVANLTDELAAAKAAASVVDPADDKSAKGKSAPDAA